jgi:conjugative transposon TraN protein
MKRILGLVCGCGYVFLDLPTRLIINFKTATSLIFPFAIRHVDRGTKDVLVQAVKEADNILLVKAAVENFPETNLSVVTDDGSVYSFIVNFDNKPPVWVYHMPTNNKETLSTYANGILDNSRTTRGIKDNSWDVLAKITGIYIKENVIYYQLRLTNNSPIDYDIELLRFYIKDKKKGNRTATQENE